MGTSPNVQALSSNSNKHSEGLTKADLLGGLSGREQAAAQLGALQGSQRAGEVEKDSLPGTAGAASHSYSASQTQPESQSVGIGGASVLPVNVPAAGAGAMTSRTEAPSTHTPLVGGHLEHSVLPGQQEQAQATASPSVSVPVSAPAPAVPTRTAPAPAPAAPPKPLPSKFEDTSLGQTLSSLTAPPSSGAPVDTPMIENLPGGWAGPKIAPGETRTSLLEDVAQGLGVVGEKAFAVLPEGVKDGINPNRPGE